MLCQFRYPVIRIHIHILSSYHPDGPCPCRVVVLVSFVSRRLLLAGQRARQRAQAETVENLVETQAAEQVVHQAAEAQAAEELADKPQDAAEQQTNGRQDLRQRLAQQAPQRVELVLGLGHVLELLLGAIDGGGDLFGELLQDIGQVVLFGRSLVGGGVVLGGGLDAAVRVEAADDAIGFGQDLAALFDEGLDFLDQGLLVEFVLGRAVGSFDFLGGGVSDYSK